MAHLLIIELPGGNDTDILRAAVEGGHRFSFITSDASLYERQPLVRPWLAQAAHRIEIPTADLSSVLDAVLKINQCDRFDAVLCLIDIRVVLAARIAQALGLPFLNPGSAALLRDKYSVRSCLRDAGLLQPEFALATSNEEVRSAIDAIGLPVLIKPSDGYGSQNILALLSEDDWVPWLSPVDSLLPSRADYGLGVKANDRLLIERYMRGQLLGCDTLSVGGQHYLLGVNEKLMFPPPSFAIRGGCFIPSGPEFNALQSYVFAALDAVGFDCGAAHTEVMLCDDGPQLVEINPRLVGAKIPRLVSAALQCDLHADLIDLHLGRISLMQRPAKGPRQFAVTRWLTSPCSGVVQAIETPKWSDETIRSVEILKVAGDEVRPPFENADRLGCVMCCSQDRTHAETIAERFIEHTHVSVEPRVPALYPGDVKEAVAS